jgi:hypothetical protein
MNKKDKINLFGYIGWLQGARDNHRHRMQVADNGADFALHKGACVALDNALTQLENFFGDKE